MACFRTSFAQAGEWRNMFDMEFTHFEKWLGPPHEDIKGLPPGTPVWKAPPWTDEFKGAPMGLNYDQKKVYTMIDDKK